MKTCVLLMAIGLLLAGCAGSFESRTADLVTYHMRMADSLEQVMALQGAAEHYALVATEFPQTSAYPVAVRKSAMLYASEFNPARNDSLALRWFTACLALPLKKTDRENFQTFIALLQRVRVLQEEVTRRTATTDSLASVARRQAGSVATDLRRIQDLEAELQQTQKELKRMKEIDLRLSKSRK